MTDALADEAEITAAECRSWRDGDWIITSISGKVVNRRLTRDRSFTYVWIVFSGNRSPDYPKVMQHFSHVEHRSDRAAGPHWRRAHWLRNRIEIPIIGA